MFFNFILFSLLFHFLYEPGSNDYIFPVTRSDYALSENEPLMMHLRHLLGQRAPEGAAVLARDNTEVALLLSEATELIGDLTDTERLLQEMQKILAQVVSRSLCVCCQQTYISLSLPLFSLSG